MINSDMHCHLLLPDLFWPERDFPGIYRELGTPALEQLLAKGRLRVEADPAEAETCEAWLCRRFGADRQGDCPVAPYSLLADGGEPGSYFWLRADPVHLKLEGNRLVLADSARFALSQLEAETLADSLNAHFSGDGLMFLPLRPDRWYLRLAQAPSLETTALAYAAGRSVDDLLPRGGDATSWRARLNEVQMLLHGHAVNAAREAAGELPINSIWLWGGGTLPEAAPVPFNSVWSGNPLAAGLAQAARIAARKLPVDAAELLHNGAATGVNLILLEDLREAAQYGDAHAWRTGLARLERDWFAPLLGELRQERIGMLSLHGLGPALALSVETTRGDLRRFWRRVKPLQDYA
ncbi:MAG: regulator [Burkholderiales bacterium]|nr:regulator [Burkholderiales bacterium]MCJ7838893.1 regulator [Burkholderiales bacterium]